MANLSIEFFQHAYKIIYMSNMMNRSYLYIEWKPFKIFRVSMVASGIVTNTFENDFRVHWKQIEIDLSVVFTHVFKDSNMVDNFHNNKLIDLDLKKLYWCRMFNMKHTGYIYLDLEKTLLFLNYLPWSFDQTRTNENRLISTWRTFGVAKVKHLVKMSL